MGWGGATVPVAPEPAPAAPDAVGSTVVDWDDVVEGLDREAKVTLPPGYDGQTPTPVVLALHGGGGTIDTMMVQHGWRQTLDDAGWIGIFPQTGRKGMGGTRGDEPGDVPYYAHLLDRAEKELAIDTARVYVVGFSAGGRGAYLLANRHGDRLTAIAAHSSSVRKKSDRASWTDPKANQVPPLSVLHIHGKRDPKIPHDGGAIDNRDHRDGTEEESVAASDGIRRWADQIGAKRDPGFREPAVGPDRLTTARFVTDEGHVVQLVLDPKLKHEWADDYANELIMRFFRDAPPRG